MKQNPNRKQILDMHLSASITYPLSLLYGFSLLKLEVKKKLVIHIVGCNFQYKETKNKIIVNDFFYKNKYSIPFFCNITN